MQFFVLRPILFGIKIPILAAFYLLLLLLFFDIVLKINTCIPYDLAILLTTEITLNENVYIYALKSMYRESLQ